MTPLLEKAKVMAARHRHKRKHISKSTHGRVKVLHKRSMERWFACPQEAHLPGLLCTVWKILFTGDLGLMCYPISPNQVTIAN